MVTKKLQLNDQLSHFLRYFTKQVKRVLRLNNDTPATNPVEKLKYLHSNEEKSGYGTTQSYRKLALMLSHEVSKTPPWGSQYINQVIKETLRPSKILIRAIEQMYAKHVQSEVEVFESVSILAPVGLIPPATLVTTPPKKCSFESCGVLFIPRNPNHKFCSKQCRQIYHIQNRN